VDADEYKLPDVPVQVPLVGKRSNRHRTFESSEPVGGDTDFEAKRRRKLGQQSSSDTESNAESEAESDASSALLKQLENESLSDSEERNEPPEEVNVVYNEQDDGEENEVDYENEQLDDSRDEESDNFEFQEPEDDD
jgi:hypothetical protein